MTFRIKLWLVQKLYVLDSIMELLEFMMELDIQYHLVLKNMMAFTKELDII